MKKILRIIVPVIVVIALLALIFRERLSGAASVYRNTGWIVNGLNQGRDELHVQLNAIWGESQKSDSLAALVHYGKGKHFLADVNMGGDRIVVRSLPEKTDVEIHGKSMVVTGAGPGQKDFDPLLIAGKIMRNHPKLKDLPGLNGWKRLGLAAWTFFKCRFNNRDGFRIISFPRDLLDTPLEFWEGLDGSTEFRLIAGEEKNAVQLTITSPVQKALNPENGNLKEIRVARGELDEAIERGAIRAAGISLENMDPPRVKAAVKKWGKGKLLTDQENRVFIARGTHREIGEAHGALLAPEVRKMVDATLYTICWIYVADRGTWFIDELRGAYKRLEPFIPQKYQEEMEGLASTSGISLEEIKLTNVFPELFHCSGFALFNKATEGGVLYHGRVLDYITELGLQYHSVVFIVDPDEGNAFANIGYAGFIGSVSGMNERQVAFGEMGGRGEGDWDGMPMGFLMREGLEKAETLDQALDLFRDTPRTCEYYYVISDGKIPDAFGLATSPKRFDIIRPNQFHPLLPHPLEDAVLMSADKRYEELAKRVKEQYGTIDAEKAIRLMDRPVAMKSNLHNVLFAPQTLEFWVSHAGPHTPASEEPYAHFSLKELLSGMDQ